MDGQPRRRPRPPPPRGSAARPPPARRHRARGSARRAAPPPEGRAPTGRGRGGACRARPPTLGRAGARISRRLCRKCAAGAKKPARSASVLPDDEVHELARHDDDLDDVLAVHVRLDPRRPGQALELLARGRRGRLHAVAELAVDLHHQLDGVALQQRRVGVRPRLLPDPRAGQQLVDLGPEVRREREDQRRGRRGREVHRGRRRGLAPPVGLVDQLHDRRDRGVEREPARHVVGDLVDRPVRLAHQLEVVALGAPSSGPSAGPGSPTSSATSIPSRHSRDQEAVHALDALVGPVGVLVGRPDEEDVAARGVGAVLLDVADGRDHVALRLGHLRPVARDHPLREQPRERLLDVEQPHVRQRLHEEARVHQVQDRVLDAADVLVDRHPAREHRRVPRRLVVARVAVAQEVPGRVDERVHRVRLALRVAAARRALDPHPVLRRGQR